MSLKVSDIGEKKLIKYILANCSDITDDDAAITPLANNNLISTTDMLIQSKHFPKKMSYFQMGYKAVTANVSDLAAMGAEPLGLLLAIAIPKNLKINNFKQIIKGVKKACQNYDIKFIGGDTNEASEIIISATALGLCDKPLKKNTYKKGDLIVLTGDVGHAALGFHLDGLNIYRQKALKPTARIKEAKKIKTFATAMTDITDGLASELYEMKKDSYGFMIYEEKLKITEEYKNIAEKLKLNYLDLILYVGEDFELIFTINKDDLENLKIDYKVIGEVNNSNKVEITLANGTVKEIENRGYNHYVS